MNIHKFALVVLPLLVSCAVQAQEPEQELPDAKGKDLLENICGSCHGTDVVIKIHTTKDKWKATVDEMAARGAEGTDQQLDTIVDYLAKCFGPVVNVNKAEAQELQTQFEITGPEATAIVQYRKDKGDFKALADLKNVPGLDFKTIEPLRYRIRFKDASN